MEKPNEIIICFDRETGAIRGLCISTFNESGQAGSPRDLTEEEMSLLGTTIEKGLLTRIAELDATLAKLQSDHTATVEKLKSDHALTIEAMTEAGQRKARRKLLSEAVAQAEKTQPDLVATLKAARALHDAGEDDQSASFLSNAATTAKGKVKKALESLAS